MSEVFSAISRAIDYIPQNYPADSMPELTLWVSINQALANTPEPLKVIISNGSDPDSKGIFFDVRFSHTCEQSVENPLNRFYNLLTGDTPDCIKDAFWEINLADKKSYDANTSALSLRLYDIRPENLKQFLTLLLKTLYNYTSDSNLHLTLIEDPEVIAEFYSL